MPSVSDLPAAVAVDSVPPAAELTQSPASEPIASQPEDVATSQENPSSGTAICDTTEQLKQSIEHIEDLPGAPTEYKKPEPPAKPLINYRTYQPAVVPIGGDPTKFSVAFGRRGIEKLVRCIDSVIYLRI